MPPLHVTRLWHGIPHYSYRVVCSRTDRRQAIHGTTHGGWSVGSATDLLLSPLRLLGRITVQEPTFRDVVLVYRLKPWALEEAMAAGLGVPPPLDTAACAETAASANADDAADDRDHDAMVPASTSVPGGGV